MIYVPTNNITFHCLLRNKINFGIIHIVQYSTTDDMDTTVAFTAYATAYRTYGHEDIIIFDRVITNIGNHYSVATDKFVCPRRCLYLFSLILYRHYDGTESVDGAIMLDGNAIGEIYTWSDDDDGARTREGDQS